MDYSDLVPWALSLFLQKKKYFFYLIWFSLKLAYYLLSL